MEPENQQFKNLIDFATILNQQNDYDEILRIVAHKAARLLDAESAIIMMMNPRTRQTMRTMFKAGKEAAQSPYRKAYTYLSGWVIKNRQPFMSSNIKNDSRFARKLFEDLPIKSALAVPLRIEGIIIGTLMVLSPDYWQDSLEQKLAYLDKIAVISAPYLRNTQKIQEYFEVALPTTALLKKYEVMGLLGKSTQFIELLKAIEAAARCDVRVSLEGPSGTGKERVAKAIHQFSARCDHPFVAVDFGAIPANLIESELFGHVKGAFTGATAERKGLFEECNQGTLFMDEISNLPLELQAKLMRVLQEGEIRPVGSNKTRQVDVRIISACSVPLHELVVSKQFREDLFYRLHVYPITVPSLEERQEDIPLLANHFLKKFAFQQGKHVEAYHEEILDFMKLRRWSGNIRELENFVERLVTLATGKKLLDRKILPKELRNQLETLNLNEHHPALRKSLNERLSEYEEKLIQEELTANKWNQSRTARILRISEQTLRYKMAKLGMVRERNKKSEN